MIDDVREAFTALRLGTPAKDELDLLRLTVTDRAVLGLDDKMRPHLLIRAEATTQDSKTADVSTLDVRTRILNVEGSPTAFVDVTCLFESVAEVFDHFVVAILERLADPNTTPESALATVLEKWRQFLTAAKAPVGREKLASVFGELLVLEDAVTHGQADALLAWRGPFGGRHDFRAGNTALEVKTTLAHTSRLVQINGEDQLASPEDGLLYLHFVRLEIVPQGGRTVAGIADELLSAGVAAEPLYNALSATGLPVAELSATDDVGFAVLERFTIPVTDATPRIIPSSFVGGERPLGIEDLTYSVNLDHVLSDAVDEQTYLSLAAGLAPRD